MVRFLIVLGRPPDEGGLRFGLAARSVLETVPAEVDERGRVWRSAGGIDASQHHDMIGVSDARLSHHVAGQPGWRIRQRRNASRGSFYREAREGVVTISDGLAKPREKAPL